MPYRFPKNKIRNGEPADPRLINSDSAPVAQEVSGRLNENNIVASTFPRTRVSPGAYYDFHAANVSSDPKFNTHSGNCDNSDVNAFVVTDNAEWQGINDLILTVPTGEDMLWVIGWCQYGIVPATANPVQGSYDGNSVSQSNTGNKPRLQFAIRVDGSIIESSITGMTEVDWGAPKPILPVTPIEILKWPKKAVQQSIHIFRTPGCQALMYHVHPVRFQAHVPVGEGSHSVEIVVRRIVQDGDTPIVNPPYVYVFNRKSVCITIRENASATGASNNVSVPSLVDGDLVSVNNVYTNNQATLATKMNALSDGNIARAGLRHEHLPSQIAFPNQIGLTTGNHTAQPYPGYASTRTPTGGVGNWVYVDNGAGTNLETTNGSYDFAANPGFVLILANVFAKRTHLIGDAAVDSKYISCFGIGQKYVSGTYVAESSSEGYINSPNVSLTYTLDIIAPVSAMNEDIYTDVPLLEWHDYRTAAPAGGAIAKWFVAASTYGDAVTPDVTYTRSNMNLIVFRN